MPSPAVPPPLLQANGADIRGGTWFETGAEMLNGGTLNYFAVPWGIVSNPLPLFAVVAVEVALMGAVEAYRRNGTGPAGYSPGVGKFDASSEWPLLRLSSKYNIKCDGCCWWLCKTGRSDCT
jgi:hypothetical protein